VRRTEQAVGPAERATLHDIPVLNRLFSDAFTERYRRDGMGGVRVPFLNPGVWEYAIANAGEGAFVWRDQRGELAAFNMVHRSGFEGWMGPLAVRVDHQERGLGHQVVAHGVDWLRQEGAATIGLETMPRTIENIGFYSRQGFLPGHLTVTLQGDSVTAVAPEVVVLGSLGQEAASRMLDRCHLLTEAVAPGFDYRRECELTRSLGLGDVAVVMTDGEPVGWVLWHTAPLAQGRRSDELRVLKLVCRDIDAARRAIGAASADAARQRLAFVTVRCQGREAALYSALIEQRWRVQWTDLRMTLAGYPEAECLGVRLSNWEI
jgi:GNAT superfamily N-acetyltransferase